jgi:hypothetical protein
MELSLERACFNEITTIGDFFIAGVRHSFVLEDTVREIEGVPVEKWKVPKKTAIPCGRFKVTLSRSERFSRRASEKASKLAGHPVTVDVILPEIHDVPGFSGVRMHGGNDADDTEGCPCLGLTKVDDNHIANCAPAIHGLIERMKEAEANGEDVWITVSNPPKK